MKMNRREGEEHPCQFGISRWFTLWLFRLMIAGWGPVAFATNLQVMRNGDQITLSWPNAATGYALESSANPNSGIWSPVTNEPSVSGLTKSVTLSANEPLFFRLRAPGPSAPSLGNASAPETITAGSTGAFSFDFADPDTDLSVCEVIVTNALGTFTNLAAAGIVGLTNTSGHASVPFGSEMLRYGTNLVSLSLRDSGGRVSVKTNFTVVLQGPSSGGTAPALQEFSVSPFQWNRPAGPYDRLKPQFHFTYSDSDGDIILVRVRVQPPTGGELVQELAAKPLGISGTNGQTLAPLAGFMSTSPFGFYRVDATLIDASGHFSNTRTALVELVELGAADALSVTGFSPAEGGAGTIITLTGSGYDGTSTVANTVELNQNPLEVLSASPSNLVVRLPGGVSSGPFVVRNSNGRSISPHMFHVPAAVEVSPTNASVCVERTVLFSAGLISTTEPIAWFVQDVPGGNTNLGTISANGLYTAPADIPTGGVLTISAKLVTDTNVFGSATVQILPPPSVPGATRILARTGGVVKAMDRASAVAVPAGACPGNMVITAQTLRGPGLPTPPVGMDLLGAATFGPSGLVFNSPVTITLPLARHFLTGTSLPLRLYAGGNFIDEGRSALVAENGREATAQVSHFSTYAALEASGSGSGAAAISTIEPRSLQEGARVPIRLTGTGLSPDLTPAVVLAGVPSADVLATDYLGHDTNAGVLLHVAAITDLAEGSDRIYTLQLLRAGSVVAQSDFTVTGLDELIVPYGQTLQLTNPPAKRYSQITVAGTVHVESGDFTLECNGPVMVTGSFNANGHAGNPGNGRYGGAAVRYGGRGGDGRDNGSCQTFCNYDGADDNNFGRNAARCIGVSAGDDRQGPCDSSELNSLATPRGLGGLPGDSFDGVGEVIQLAGDVIECIGSVGVACAVAALDAVNTAESFASFVNGENTGRTGFGNVVPGDRALSAGGGGGGAGRIGISASNIPGLDALLGPLAFFGDLNVSVTGGGGGSGGEAAQGMVITTPDTITVDGELAARGGDGGDGSATGRIQAQVKVLFIGERDAGLDGVPAFRGGGGGGGAGGAVIATAGSGVSVGSSGDISVAGGAAGIGGVTYIDSENQSAYTGSARVPAANGTPGFANVTGPLYLTLDGNRGIETTVTDRSIVRLRLNTQDSHPKVVYLQYESGQIAQYAMSVQSGFQTAIVPLHPGFNVIFGPNHFLDINILSLPVDTDGDGLSDPDEQDAGTNPALADTDGDGANDLQEILAGTDPNNPDADLDGLGDHDELVHGTDPAAPDTDHDGVWDGAEVFLGSDPLDTNSVPTSVPFGTIFTQARGPQGGSFLAMINPANGQMGLLGKPNLGLGFGFAFNPAGQVYIAKFNRLAVVNDLLHADAAGNLATTDIGGFGSPDGVDLHVLRMAYCRPDRMLYGVELGAAPDFPATGQLVRIDPATGAGTRVGTPGNYKLNAITFDTTGVLYATINTNAAAADRLVKLERTTGAVVQDIGEIGYSDVVGLVASGTGALVGAYLNGPNSSKLLTINMATGQGTVISTPPIERNLFGLDVTPSPAATFQLASTLTLPVPPEGNVGVAVGIADMNGDGTNDLVAAYWDGTNTSLVQVFLGHGGTNFTAQPPFAFNGIVFNLTIADFNADGKKDVAVLTERGAGQTITDIHVVLGNGAGAFSSEIPFHYTAQTGGYTVGFMVGGEFTGDTNIDLAVGDNGRLVVLAGNGTGALQPTSFLYDDPNYSSAYWEIAAADFNQDGSLDLVGGGGALPVFIATNHSYPNLQEFEFGAICCPQTVAAADVNGDGHPDIVTVIDVFDGGVHPDREAVFTFLGDGSGQFTTNPPQIFDLSPAPSHNGAQRSLLKDLDGDGSADLLTLSGRDHQGLYFYTSDGSGGFLRPIRIATGGNFPVDMAIGDLNGDGKPDVAIANSNPMTITLLFNHPFP